MTRPVQNTLGSIRPDAVLAVKLGSIARHAEELLEPEGRPEDAQAIRSLLRDPDVHEWMQSLDRLALLPVKR